jgi:hypothetical protein
MAGRCDRREWIIKRSDHWRPRQVSGSSFAMLRRSERIAANCLKVERVKGIEPSSSAWEAYGIPYFM